MYLLTGLLCNNSLFPPCSHSHMQQLDVSKREHMAEEAKEDIADAGVAMDMEEVRTSGRHLQIISKGNNEDVDAELEHSFHRHQQHWSCSHVP